MASSMKEAFDEAVQSGEIPLKKRQEQPKRKGKRSTGELTLRVLRFLLCERQREMALGHPNRIHARRLVKEIDGRLEDYEAERGGPRGPS